MSMDLLTQMIFYIKFLIEVSIPYTLIVYIFYVSLSLTDALDNVYILNLFRSVVVWMHYAQIQLTLWVLNHVST
jgi:hypothetical protein